MILLLRPAHRLQVYVLRDILRMHGIAAHVFNEHMASIAGEVPPDVAGVELWLDDERDLERARAVLAAHASEGARTGPVACTRCGEDNPPNFELCWNCGAYIW
jgi:hypothetical protein